MMLLQEMTWPEVSNLSRDIPVVVPVAALEQHGEHMPLFTDSLLVGEVVRRVGTAMTNKVLIGPLMWLGNSHHHMDFQGTLSASPRVYLDLLNDLAENLIAHGFRRIVFINGHGGNITPGKQAIFEIRQRHRDRADLLLLFASYWDDANPTADRPDLVQSQMGHACEWETSMMLRLAPHLVKDYKHAAPVGFGFGFEPAYRGWTTKDRTVTGHIGHPQAATAEKGEHLFATYAAGVIRLLEKVIAWDGKSWDTE
jgi:creatinine amidohydrolase